MAGTVEFWFDVGSAASYVAWYRLPKIAQRTGATIDYRPMLLGGVFQATGNQSPVNIRAKGEWLHKDLERFAQRDGTPYKRNPHFPINTLALMRIAIGLQQQGEEPMLRFVDAVFRAIFAEPKNMNDAPTVAGVLQDAGFDPEALMALAGDPAIKERLKAVTAEAVQRGVFGAPTFFVGGEMHWGQDRLDWVEQALQGDA
jgi:2-hydroxychromene-2-carboxylate isomerase